MIVGPDLTCIQIAWMYITLPNVINLSKESVKLVLAWLFKEVLLYKTLFHNIGPKKDIFFKSQA